MANIPEVDGGNLTEIESRKDLVNALNEAELDKLNNDLMEDIIETPYTSKRMVLIAQRYELDTTETQEIAKIIKDYKIKPLSVEKILEAGIQPPEVESFVHLYKKLNSGGFEIERKELESLSNEKGFGYFIPNASGCISYDNLLFVQKFINGTADQVGDAFYSLNMVDDEESGPGIGVLVSRMKEFYEKGGIYRDRSLESLAYICLNKLPDYYLHT